MGTGFATGTLAVWLALATALGIANTAPAPAGGTSVATTPETTVDLADHQWQHRLVLVFAPTATDVDLAAQEATFAERQAEIADRDLLIGRLPADGTGQFDGQTISAAGIAALREELGVDPAAFTVLLIGKDGGVKLRSATPLTADRIFAVIDSMPMRQQERQR